MKINISRYFVFLGIYFLLIPIRMFGRIKNRMHPRTVTEAIGRRHLTTRVSFTSRSFGFKWHIHIIIIIIIALRSWACATISGRYGAYIIRKPIPVWYLCIYIRYNTAAVAQWYYYLLAREIGIITIKYTFGEKTRLRDGREQPSPLGGRMRGRRYVVSIIHFAFRHAISPRLRINRAHDRFVTPPSHALRSCTHLYNIIYMCVHTCVSPRKLKYAYLCIFAHVRI
jgi:hypothetical protein